MTTKIRPFYIRLARTRPLGFGPPPFHLEAT